MMRQLSEVPSAIDASLLTLRVCHHPEGRWDSPKSGLGAWQPLDEAGRGSDTHRGDLARQLDGLPDRVGAGLASRGRRSGTRARLCLRPWLPARAGGGLLRRRRLRTRGRAAAAALVAAASRSRARKVAQNARLVVSIGGHGRGKYRSKRRLGCFRPKSERARESWVNVGRHGFCRGAGQICIFLRIRSVAPGYMPSAP
jgi:hypothetical protein